MHNQKDKLTQYNRMSYVFTVIIPHKDSLSLLRRCVASIPLQEDIQLIIVDDDSNVSEAEWNEFYTENSHVELYLTHEGRGAGYARNVGLSHAIGTWVIFADADDFFYPDAFLHLNKYIESDLDIIYFNSDGRDGVTLEKIGDRMPSIRQYIKDRNFNLLRYQSLVPWGKMIKRKVIEENQIRFDEVEVSNDVMFSIKLGYAVQKIDVIDSTLYCCTANKDSLHFHQTISRVKTRIRIYKKACAFMNDHQRDEYRMPLSRGIWGYIKYLLPKHPFTFIWCIWTARYKEHTKEYLKELCEIGKNWITPIIHHQV